MVEAEFIRFYSELMGTRAENLPCPNDAFIREGPCLIYEQKCRLVVPVTEEEIMLAIKSMPTDKSPGIDGFPIEFFVKNWTVVKLDVVQAIQDFFHVGKMLKAFSCTSVTLIPKIPNPAQVKDYRPIACCTTFYKIITKILTNRMKLVVDHIVSPPQSAFIKGRSIIDNVLISHEILKWYTRKGQSPQCVMKVDLRKAYDSIEWCFLESIMAELGFPYLFIKWVMACITSVSYSLLFFGGLTAPFEGKKGIRQGDPMSPYLFVLAMEYIQKELYQLDKSIGFEYHPRCKRLGITHV